jgi:hypothetical protein
MENTRIFGITGRGKGQDMHLEELSGGVVIIGTNLRQVAKAAAAVGCKIAAATIELGTLCAAFEERELYRALQAEADKLDPITELLQAMEELKELDLLETMAQLAEELAEDIPPLPPKIPRPPKRLGPVKKANYTASRPPRRARSSCYKCHR